MSRGKWNKNKVTVKDRELNPSVDISVQGKPSDNPLAIIENKTSDETVKLKPYLFGQGQTGNRKGRPKVPEIQLVREALAETEISKKKNLWKHLVERAYKSDVVLIALAKKFLPDKMEDEGFNRLVRTILIRSAVEWKQLQAEDGQLEQLNESIDVLPGQDQSQENVKSDPVNESKPS